MSLSSTEKGDPVGARRLLAARTIILTVTRLSVSSETCYSSSVPLKRAILLSLCFVDITNCAVFISHGNSCLNLMLLQAGILSMFWDLSYLFLGRLTI